MGSQTSTARQQAFSDAHRSGIPGVGPLPPRDLGDDVSLPSGIRRHSSSVVDESFSRSPSSDAALYAQPTAIASTQQQDEKEEEYIPCVFTWTHGGHVVYLTGSFNGWSVENKIRLVRSGHDFSSIQNLPRGVHYYKFIVDDQWKYAPDQLTQSDEHGNINNILDTSGFRHFQLKIASEYEQARTAVYRQCVPEPSEYTSDAPVIPLLLSKSTYMTVETPPRSDIPLHCLANHLYHDAHAPHIFGPHISCIASTQRWRIDNARPTSGQRYATYIYLTVNPLYPFSPPGDGDGDDAGEADTPMYINLLKDLLVVPLADDDPPTSENSSAGSTKVSGHGSTTIQDSKRIDELVDDGRGT